MKKCSKCGKTKDDSCFYVQKSGRHKGKLTSWCKECCSKQTSEYYKNNKKKCNKVHRDWVSKNKEKVAFSKAKSSYGITEEEYKNLKRVCQICGSTKKLVIDHSHKTGRIRGMLCQNCNKGIGFLQDSPVLLERASDYLFGVHEEIEPDIFEKTYEVEDETPKIRIESDGKTAVIYLNGKHIKSPLIDFSFHGDAENGIHIKWDGILHKLDENGRVYVENDEIAIEKFHYDSHEAVEP